jgi:hypothetical protein
VLVTGSPGDLTPEAIPPSVGQSRSRHPLISETGQVGPHPPLVAVGHPTDRGQGRWAYEGLIGLGTSRSPGSLRPWSNWAIGGARPPGLSLVSLGPHRVGMARTGRDRVGDPLVREGGLQPLGDINPQLSRLGCR